MKNEPLRKTTLFGDASDNLDFLVNRFLESRHRSIPVVIVLNGPNNTNDHRSMLAAELHRKLNQLGFRGNYAEYGKSLRQSEIRVDYFVVSSNASYSATEFYVGNEFTSKFVLSAHIGKDT